MSIEEQFVLRLAPRLENFTQTGTSVWNFRCPLCGDSQKSKSKSRGYVMGDTGRWVYYCHNCGESLRFSKFIEHLDTDLYKEYQREKMRDKPAYVERRQPQKEIKDVTLTKLEALPALDALVVDHPAVVLAHRRKIPPQYLNYFRYAENFRQFVQSTTDRYPKLRSPNHRIIIPLIDPVGRFLGFQGRSIDPSPTKYLTILFAKDNPKIFGLDRIDFLKPIYVTEGPLDAIHLSNAIAVCGGTIHQELKKAELPKDKITIIYDFEPRSKHTVKKMSQAIEAGYKVFFWPDVGDVKDVNEYVMKYGSVDGLVNVLDEMTFFGLQAKLKLNDWKKV